jgi:hypothetical protein
LRFTDSLVMPKRRLLASMAGLAAFAVLGTGVAHAAGGAALGDDGVAVTSCTDAGVRADFEVAGLTVRAVTVAGMPDACVGQTVTVTLTRDSGADLSASAPVTGRSTRLALTAPVPAADVSSLGVLIAG